MCDTVCEGAPEEQDGFEAWYQRPRLAAHWSWPVRKWFNIDHKRRHRLNPGGAMEGSMISERFTTSEAAHPSVCFCRGDTFSCCDSLSHTVCLDVTMMWWNIAKYCSRRISIPKNCNKFIDSSKNWTAVKYFAVKYLIIVRTRN